MSEAIVTSRASLRQLPDYGQTAPYTIRKRVADNPEVSAYASGKKVPRRFKIVGEVQDASVAFRRYSLGATRNTRLNALLKAASDS